MPAQPSYPGAATLGQGMESRLAELAAGAVSLRQAERDGITVEQGRVVVQALTAPARTGAALAAIGRAGGIVDAAAPGIVEAEIAPAELAALSRGAAVRYLEAMVPDSPTAVTGQGVDKSGAGSAQGAGVTGAGVKVAVIDSGFTGYQASQASGDLPAGVTTQNFCAGGFEGGTVTKHGTGVAEIVAEMAPGAQLYLVCASSAAELAVAEQYAVSQGVAVVNRSASNFTPAVRGDGSGGPGTEDATVEDAVTHGILWVNSGGNEARTHWGGGFSDANGNGFHDWAAGDETNSFSLSAGNQACMALKWDSWPTTSQDFNLRLYSGAVVVDSSNNVQNGSQPPAERLCYTNPGPTGVFDAVVVNQGGGVPGTHMDLFVYDGPSSISRPVAAGSVPEPASAPEAFGVAAVCPLDDSLQSYSSQGPTIDGRIKPDIGGYAPVDSASYGPVTGNGCSGGFSGTSAAAPHVAGAAALYKQAQPGAGPAQLRALLEQAATDLGTPGKDNQFGAGELALRGIPDLLIKGKGKPVGDGVYGAAQIAKRKVRSGHATSYRAFLQNDGPLPATFVLRGGKTHGPVALAYLLNGKNVTKKVEKGRLGVGVLPGGSAKLTIRVKTTRAAHGKRKIPLSATNSAAPSLIDAVTAKLKIR